MKFYKKRIAFLISDQHFIPHGGIGSFCKSFFEMCEDLNYRVDIILDKKPRKSILFDYLSNNEVNFYYPESKDSISYSNHTNTFAFTDSICLEKMANFRQAMMMALNHHVYDGIIFNTPEAALGVYPLNIHSYVPSIFYTHNENIVFFKHKTNTFNDAFDELSLSISNLKGIITGTQTDRNQKIISNNFPNSKVESLPMQIPEKGLLEFNDYNNREGVLFIGRYEDRKNPETFVKLVKSLNIKALVLTNESGKKKFISQFEKHNIHDYEIKAGVIGEEKVKFIQKAAYAFHPAKLESFGFSAFETLHSCPTFAITEYEWWVNFEGLVYNVSKANFVSEIKEYINSNNFDLKNQFREIQNIHENTSLIWKNFFEQNQIQNKSTRKTKPVELLDQEDHFITVKSLFDEKMKRNNLAIEDAFSIFNENIIVKQTKKSSLVSTNPESEVVSDQEDVMQMIFSSA